MTSSPILTTSMGSGGAASSGGQEQGIGSFDHSAVATSDDVSFVSTESAVPGELSNGFTLPESGIPSQSITARRQSENEVPTRLLLDIEPHSGVGPFLLGASLRQILDECASRSITIDFVYDTKNQYASNWSIHLPTFGITLYISPKSQRLIRVTLSSFTHTILTHKSTTFASLPTTEPYLKTIFKLFGPTFPGVVEEAGKVFRLSYPGLDFLFGVPERFWEHPDLVNESDIPLEWPDGSTPVCDKITVFDASPSSANPTQCLIDQGIAIIPGLIKIQLGQTSVQDVIGTLGYPEQVHHKQDQEKYLTFIDAVGPNTTSQTARPEDVGGSGGETSTVGTTTSQSPQAKRVGGFFYCYFTRGFDLFFDAGTGLAKKVVLHTNAPGHYEFHKYDKCIFEVIKDPETDPLSCDSPWEDIKSVFGDHSHQSPIVCNRGLESAPNASTRFWGYHRVVFEVMKNDYVATVIMF